jgi:Tol biopolymer transport system component
MRLRNLIFIALVFSLILVSSGFTAQSAEQLFQSAQYEEKVTGDLEKAIALYNKVLGTSPSESLAAKAQLQIGICYEKLGKTEAIKAYELVLEKYSGQKEQAAAARARLAELKRKEPEGFSVSTINFSVPPGLSIQLFDVFPDGKKILGVEMIKGQNIIVCNLETQKVKYITDLDWNKTENWTYNPILSPDGKEIAYLEACQKNFNRCGSSLKAATLDGTSRILISSDKDRYVPNAWMPDGSAVLTIKSSMDGSIQLGLVPREGGTFKKLTDYQWKGRNPGGRSASACVSPDGRFSVFTDSIPGGSGDLYIISIEGGTVVPLIEHPAAENLPRWSPDGKHIVFLSQRTGSWALWGVAVKDGKAAGDPFLIREGMKDTFLLNWTSYGLAARNWISMNDVFLMDVDQKTGTPLGKPTQIKYTPTGQNWFAVWAPDGEHFAFLRTDDSQGRHYINVLRANGSSPKEFPVPAGNYPGYLRWTPDGSSIGMMGMAPINGKNSLLRLDLASEEWKKISVPVEETWTRFEWSANGKAFLYSKNGRADEGAGIYERNLETGLERLVYSNPDSRVNFRELRCSRDYKWLAFMESNKIVKVVNMETGESHLAASDVGYPSWSPDGKKLLGMRAFGGDKEHMVSLFILPVSGGTAKEIDLSKHLPQGSRIMRCDWSPNGKQIIISLNQNISDLLVYKNVIPEGK